MEKATFLASNVLSGIAFKAAQRGAADSDQNLIAVLFSAAWFESCLNEVLSDLLERPTGQSDDRIQRIRLSAEAAGLGERMVPLERRLRVLAAAAMGESLPADRAPWRDVFLLFRLRNWMLHLRPEHMSVRPGRPDEPSSLVSLSVHQLVRDLHDAGAIASIPEGRLVPVVVAASLDGVGRWAYRSAYGGLEGLVAWLPGWNHRLLADHQPPSAIDAAV